MLGMAPAAVTEDALAVARQTLEADEIILVHPSDKERPRGADKVLVYTPPIGMRHVSAFLSFPCDRGDVGHVLIAWNMPGAPPLEAQALVERFFPHAFLWLARAHGELFPIGSHGHRSGQGGATLREIRDDAELDAALAEPAPADVYIVPDDRIAERLRARRGVALHRVFVVSPERDGRYPEPFSTDRAASVRRRAEEMVAYDKKFPMIPTVAERMKAKSSDMMARLPRLSLRPGRSGAGRTFILMYHQIVAAEVTGSDPFLLRVTKRNFEDQLRALRAAGEIIPLSRVGEPEGDRPRFAITFDDGMEDNIRVAIPILEAMTIPATFFLVTNACENGSLFWWDVLAAVADFPPEIMTAARRIVLPADRGRACAVLADAMKRVNTSTRSEILEALRYRDDAVPRPALWNAWKAIRSDLFELGCHTRTHPMLSALAPLELREEIANARAIMEEELGRTIASFAYPFGQPLEVGEDAIEEARAAGFTSAVTTTHSPVHPGTDPHALPRIAVRDWSGADLMKRLSP